MAPVPAAVLFDLDGTLVDSESVWDEVYCELAGRELPAELLSRTDGLGVRAAMQLVHSELDWRRGVGWGADTVVAVSTARLRRTSFALDFQVLVAGEDGREVTCDARTVYVVIAVDGSGKQEIPPIIANALGEPRPLLPDRG